MVKIPGKGGDYMLMAIPKPWKCDECEREFTSYPKATILWEGPHGRLFLCEACLDSTRSRPVDDPQAEMN